MKKTKLIVTLVMIAIMIALLVVAGITGGAQSTVDCPDCEPGNADCETCIGQGVVVASFWALLPPIIAIVLALITKEVYSTLFGLLLFYVSFIYEILHL